MQLSRPGPGEESSGYRQGLGQITKRLVARLPLMPDLTREHGGLRSAQAIRAKAPWSRMTHPAANTKWD